MKKIAPIIAFLLTSFCVQAQDVNKLIDQNDVLRIIKTLSADDMQGRATFTPGIEKAAKFIENEYRQIGLEPLQGDVDFRQSFTMMRSTPVKLQVNINGAAIPAENVSALACKSFNWANDPDVQVVTLGKDKDFRKEILHYLHPGKKSLVLIDTAFGRMFKAISGHLANGGTFFKTDTNHAVIFVLGKFDVKSYQVKYESTTAELPLFNIAGMIPGKTKPNEYVVFSGHYDHLGILKPVQGDSIANGADDDASGTTAVITLAKYYKALNNNARTLVFVAFTAEEIGEYGSQYFAQNADPDKIMAMFNIEMIGRPSKFGENNAFITGYDRTTFGPILQKNLEGTSFKFYPDPYPELDLFYRSDNASLAEAGVPAHTISTDQIDADQYYHTVKDELSTLDIANITATIKAIALSSRTIVSGQDTPTRLPKVEDK